MVHTRFTAENVCFRKRTHKRSFRKCVIFMMGLFCVSVSTINGIKSVLQLFLARKDNELDGKQANENESMCGRAIIDVY